MGKKSETHRTTRMQNIKADVIILGCSIPGIVTAHKLKKKFGNSMEIVVLDLSTPKAAESRIGVAFQKHEDDDSDSDSDIPTHTVRNNVAKYFLLKYAEEYNISIPDAIISPLKTKSKYEKVFQHRNGSVDQFNSDYNSFSYLGFLQRFELSQYHSQLDRRMREIFNFTPKFNIATNKKTLLYYDSMTMESHICGSLLFPSSRETMRTVVRLVCGVSTENISVLFYLHQCYRTRGSANHIDGDNTRLREKLLRFCSKRLTNGLQKSVADITVPAKTIKGIRTYSGAQVILETMVGETNYVCNLLAMALRPDQLTDIKVDKTLLSDTEAAVIKKMVKTHVKRFLVTYNDHFWRNGGYSGDIVSIQGPIIWAMEKPKLTTANTLETYPALIGYLKAVPGKDNRKEEVLNQLVKLFGDEAANPINYRETDITDVLVPRCGDYVALRSLIDKGNNKKFLEWGALDIFGDGDLAAALEAGNDTYLHLAGILRPQAASYEDKASRFTTLDDNPFKSMFSHINYISSARTAVLLTAVYVGVRLIKSYINK